MHKSLQRIMDARVANARRVVIAQAELHREIGWRQPEPRHSNMWGARPGTAFEPEGK